MTLPLLVVDAFADRPFTGNPAAVCLLPGPREAAWMQFVAAEMNLSETAFVEPGGADGGFGLRWFTPAAEVDLCGHATLAAAHVLWQTGRLPSSAAAVFQTRSGRLTAERAGDGLIEMDFPAVPQTPEPPPAGLLPSLGVSAVHTGRNRMDWLVEAESEAAVRAMAPDLARLSAVEARGVIVTARAATPGFDFVSRFFAPRVGVPEDPVTGSAHCCLAPYWAAKLGRSELVGLQVSRRTGVVRVRLAGNRVRLGGRAVTVSCGELMV